MKKRWIAGGVAAALYLILLRLLVLAEAGSAHGTIHTMGQAAWYSLVTLTTVGYGDYAPVTFWGRVIGLVFLLLSTGLLAVLLGLAVSFLSGSLLPKLKLWMGRNRTWYVFSEQGPEALALADNLQAEEPGALIVFLDGELREQRKGRIGLRWSAEEAARRKRHGCSFFYMGEDEAQTVLQARRCCASGLPVYAGTSLRSEQLPPNLTVFSAEDCCARLYWQQHPLHQKEQTVLLLGCEKFGTRLLEQALLVNVYGPERTITYHVFGDSTAFQNNHFALKQAFAAGTRGDRLVFHEDVWNAEPELLQRADRILLAYDREAENLELLKQLRAFFPTDAAVHVRCEEQFDGAFGARTALFTPALVMRKQLNQTAKAMHGLYLQGAGQEGPAWEELSAFTQASNLASADHLLTKVRLLLQEDGIDRLTEENCQAAFAAYERTRTVCGETYRRMEHERWMRFHLLYNWQYGEKKDPARRTHPDLRDFEQLSLAEQAKDDYAWELLEAVAGVLSNETKEERGRADGGVHEI